MRYFEIASGFRIPVDREEQDVLDKVGSSRLANSELDEREAEIARLMVSKGLLKRHVEGKQIYFTANSIADVWRL